MQGCIDSNEQKKVQKKKFLVVRCHVAEKIYCNVPELEKKNEQIFR